MPTEIPIRDFKARLSHYLSRLQTGETLCITSHRKPVALVQGVAPTAGDGLSRLLSSGAARWAGGKPKGAQIRLGPSERTVAALVIEDRG